MPPVAENETTQWETAMWEALQANLERDGLPHTWYALSRALAAQQPKTQAETWLSTLKRIRKGKLVPAEERAQMIAEALGVGREFLPESSERLTLRLLEARLATAEAALNILAPHVDELDQRLSALEKRSPPNTGQAQSSDEG